MNNIHIQLKSFKRKDITYVILSVTYITLYTRSYYLAKVLQVNSNGSINSRVREISIPEAEYETAPWYTFTHKTKGPT